MSEEPAYMKDERVQRVLVNAAYEFMRLRVKMELQSAQYQAGTAEDFISLVELTKSFSDDLIKVAEPVQEALAIWKAENENQNVEKLLGEDFDQAADDFLKGLENGD